MIQIIYLLYEFYSLGTIQTIGKPSDTQKV